MDLAGIQRLTRCLPSASHVPSISDNLTHTGATIISLCDEHTRTGYGDDSVRSTAFRYIASSSAFSRRSFTFQARPTHLKGLSTRVHYDRGSVCMVRAWRCEGA